MHTERVGPAPVLAVDHAGEGDLAVFLHGIGGNRTNWREQVSALSGRYRAVAVDIRGWGGSDDYDGKLSVDDMEADVLRVLDHFGAARAHVVGLSMGGLVAQHLWFRHPGRVRSLTLCDTSPGLTQSHSREELEEFLRLRQKPLLEGKTPAEIAPGVARTLAGSAATPRSMQRLIESLSALHVQSYLKALEAVTYHTPVGDIASITAPCLLMVGAEDKLTPPAISAGMQQRIAGSRLVVLPGAGHLSNIEAPDAFNAALLQFLDDVG